jgi:hypothetical protein
MRAVARSVATAVVAAVLGAVVAVVGMPVAGQAPASGVPRLADGRPDLNGIWQALNEANYDIQMHVARPALALRDGPYGPVPDAPVVAFGAVGAVPPGVGVIDGDELPYRPEALKTKQEHQQQWLTRDPEIKCYLPGVPRATYMPHPFQIVQSSSQLLIAYQYAGAVRDIHLKDPGPAPVDSWMGQSVARWDGDTLVVDVTGMNDQTWFDRAGNFHSDSLHVVERYTRTSADVISYEATIEDPQVFTRPWKMTMPLYRRQERNAQLMDFKCVEFVEELMYGQWRKKPLAR